jgi:tetratricopeptide (TPR) repeat protein
MTDPHDTSPATADKSAERSQTSSWLGSGLTTRTGIAVAVALLLVLAGFLGWAWWSYRQTESGHTSGPDYLVRWRSAVALNPNDLRARVELAYALRLTGQHEAALKQLNVVLGREPRNSAALYNRGLVYFALDSPKKAENDLRTALSVQPDFAQAAVALGRYYAETGEYRKLFDTVRPVSNRQPSIAELQYLTGLSFEKTGRPERAAVRYRKALELNPDLLEARQGLARVEDGR